MSSQTDWVCKKESSEGGHQETNENSEGALEAEIGERVHTTTSDWVRRIFMDVKGSFSVDECEKRHIKCTLIQCVQQ